MKRILIFTALAGLISCNCLPQIPTQYLPADRNCEALLPNYLPYISVFDNCRGGTLTQHPLPGTVLNENNPWVTVTIVAEDLGGRTDAEQFTAVLDDGIAPEIIWDSIPGDTVPIVRVNDIDLLFESVDAYRAHIGEPLQDSLLVWRVRQ